MNRLSLTSEIRKNSKGVLRADVVATRQQTPLYECRLELPGLRRACYFAPFQKHAINPSLDLWPEGYNQCQPLVLSELRNLKRGGMFLIAELQDGSHLALLPLVTNTFMCWLRADSDSLLLEGDHWGTDGINATQMPLLAWAVADHVYPCTELVWQVAAHLPELKGHLRLRETKKFPDVFEYLGWCTWEELKWDITEEKLRRCFFELAQSKVPVCWLLIDDGHIEETSCASIATQSGEVPQGEAQKTLAGLGVNARRFPNGWRPVMKTARECGFQKIGVWLNFNGYWGGIAKNNQLGDLNNALIEVSPGVLQPAPGKSHYFYDALIEKQQEAGFTFVKVDNQAKNVTFYRGAVPNAVAAASANHEALESAIDRFMEGMINCMAHNNICVFNTRVSSVTRCSEDYKKGDYWRAKHHLNNSFANMLWLRHTVWGDHDMFHSCDQVAGGVMARSKAISGGPIYLSDAPDQINAEAVAPLCYSNGKILRVLEPAVPAPESVYIDSYESNRAFRVLAPASAHATVVIAYNLTDPQIPVTGFVENADDGHAQRLLCGRMPVKREVVIFRWHDKSVRVLPSDERWEFTIPSFGDELFWLVERQNGWALLGRADKYLGPAAVIECCYTSKVLSFRLVEPGPVLIWLESGRPYGGAISWEALGNGLWIGNCTQESCSVECL